MIKFRNLKPADWDRVHELTQAAQVEDTSGIVCYDDEKPEHIKAVAVFDNWTFTSVQIHVAVVDKWVMRQGFVEEVFNFLFNTAGRKMVFGLTPSNNEVALKFNEHIGFETVMVMEDAYDVGIDYIVTRLLKSNCKWINHGKEEHSGAARLRSRS
jgi:hypothetical protein